MKRKWPLFVVAGIGIAAVASKCASMCSSQTEQSSESEKPTKWDKMRARMEQMPEDFPPRVMFDNAQAARQNTERILEILETADLHDPTMEALAGALR